MTNEIKTTIEDGKITIEVDLDNLWFQLSDWQREQILRDQAWWTVVKDSLEYELGKSLSTPNFNYSIHELRKMITTDVEFVNAITVEFVKQILEEISHATQKERAAVKAYWELYHWVRNNFPGERVPDGPYNIAHGEPHIRVSSKEVEKDIRNYFVELLKESAE